MSLVEGLEMSIIGIVLSALHFLAYFAHICTQNIKDQVKKYTIWATTFMSDVIASLYN